MEKLEISISGEATVAEAGGVSGKELNKVKRGELRLFDTTSSINNKDITNCLFFDTMQSKKYLLSSDEYEYRVLVPLTSINFKNDKLYRFDSVEVYQIDKFETIIQIVEL